MNPTALLDLISDLVVQVQTLTQENAQKDERIAELEAKDD